MKLKRPSIPTVIALLALFVALGGPAQAERFVSARLGKASVNSRAIKDRAIQMRDLNRRTVRQLRSTQNNSITEAKLANGAVTPGKIAPGAVGTTAIEDRSVGATDLAPASVGASSVVDGSITGAKIADGSLAAQDLARFHGRFRIEMPAIAAGTCWSAVPTGLAPEQAGADISQDLVLATPGANWQQDQLAFTVTNDGEPTRFVLSACNVTSTPVPAAEVGFRYVVIDLP